MSVRKTRAGWLVAVPILATCNDQSLYEHHRGAFPENYRDRVRSAIESTWPEPRAFRVLAISPPHRDLVLTRQVFSAKRGAWLGCLRIEGIAARGAGYGAITVPYALDYYQVGVVLEEEPRCRYEPFEPWPDMQAGPEA